MSSFLGFSLLPQGQQKHQLAQGGSPQPIGRVQQQQQQQTAGDIRRLIDQYNCEADRVAEQLSLCGISQQSLSDEAQHNLQLIAKLASLLGLALAKPQLVLAAWAALLVRESKATVLQHKLRGGLTALRQDRTKARQKLVLLQKVLADVQAKQGKEAARVRDKAKQTEQMQHKDKDYHAVIRKESRKLEQSGFKPEITHAALLAKHEQVQALAQRLKDLQAQLAGYHQLPATLLGARMRLQEAKKQLEKKHLRFQSQLADTS